MDLDSFAAPTPLPTGFIQGINQERTLTGTRHSPEFHFRARVFVKPGDSRIDDFFKIPGGGLFVPVYEEILADIEIGLGFAFPPFMRKAG